MIVHIDRTINAPGARGVMVIIVENERSEFKTWARLFVFHIALIPFPKVLIQLFSL